MHATIHQPPDGNDPGDAWIAQRRRHLRNRQELGWYMGPGTPDDRTHGYTATYNAGCRCDDCKRANRDAKRLRRARRAAKAGAA